MWIQKLNLQLLFFKGFDNLGGLEGFVQQVSTTITIVDEIVL